MKKYMNLLTLCIMTFFVSNVNSIMAQNRGQARAFLNRTNKVIMKAKGSVNVGQVYTGDLVKAVYHQKFARSLYKDGKYTRAIHHSSRSRALAFAAIKANKHEVAKEMELQKDEQALVKGQPDNNFLDAEVEIPKDADDKSVMQIKEDDVKE